MIERAVKRMKQRSKLPAGDRIIPLACQECGTKILCWNDDFMLSSAYPYKRKCTYCREAEKAENRAIWKK
jgi:hypothetical protein